MSSVKAAIQNYNHIFFEGFTASPGSSHGAYCFSWHPS